MSLAHTFYGFHTENTLGICILNLSRPQAGFQSVPMRVDFLMFVTQSVTDGTSGEKAGDLEVLGYFQQLKLL